MGKTVEKIEHSVEVGGCGSSDGLQVFQEANGSYNGYCYSCNTYVRDPYSQYPKGHRPPPARQHDPEKVKQQVQEILECPIKGIEDRGIRQSTCEKYGVRVGVSQKDGETITTHFYPYVTADSGGEVQGFNVRVVDGKKFFAVGNRKNALPFGWNNRKGGRRLYITEGEIDCMSLSQVLEDSAREWVRKNGKEWTDMYIPDVISAPGAGLLKQALSNLADTIEQEYAEVRIVPDNDDAGKKMVQDAVSALEGRDIKMFVANLPAKDVNELLVAGRQQDIVKSCVYNASEKISGKVIRSNELWNMARERPKMGAPWPWEEMTELTRGKRLGEVYYFGAG